MPSVDIIDFFVSPSDANFIPECIIGCFRKCKWFKAHVTVSANGSEWRISVLEKSLILVPSAQTEKVPRSQLGANINVAHSNKSPYMF